METVIVQQHPANCKSMVFIVLVILHSHTVVATRSLVKITATTGRLADNVDFHAA